MLLFLFAVLLTLGASKPGPPPPSSGLSAPLNNEDDNCWWIREGWLPRLPSERGFRQRYKAKLNPAIVGQPSEDRYRLNSRRGYCELLRIIGDDVRKKNKKLLPNEYEPEAVEKVEEDKIIIKEDL